METKEKIKTIKKDATKPKELLISLYREMAVISPTQAQKLEKIILRLEAWQNS